MTKIQIQALENRDSSTSVRSNHLTLNEIADMLDLTRERVRQIEAKALLKIKKRLHANGISLQDLI